MHSLQDPAPGSEPEDRAIRGTPTRHRTAFLELLAGAIQEGEAWAEIRGSCMEPLVLDGDRVAAVPLKERALPGALVLAHNRRGDLVCHRVLSCSGDRFQIAGDRSFLIEDHPADSVLGRISKIQRRGRTLQLAPSPRSFDRAEARLHLLAYRAKGRPGGRLLEGMRQILLRVRGLLWLLSQGRKRSHRGRKTD